MDPVPDSNLHKTREVVARMFEDLYAQSTRDLLQAASRDEIAQVAGLMAEFSDLTNQMLKCLRGRPLPEFGRAPPGLTNDFNHELLERLDGWMQQIFESRALKRVPAEPPPDADFSILNVEVPT